LRKHALAVEACVQKPEVLPTIYRFVQAFRPETADETIRARIYEAVSDGKVVRVARGVYFARSGPAELLMVEADAWEVLSKLEDDSADALVTDPPGRFGREWAGQGTTRPHAKLHWRTYRQPEIDADFMKQAFRVLRKARDWNTLSKVRKAAAIVPKGGAACLIRVPIENRTTRPHVQKLIHLAQGVGFVFYGEIIVELDKLGMGYDAGRDMGAKWLLFHAGERNGTLWDYTLPNVINARRVRNPCSRTATQHEAEKDPTEFVRLIRAVTREGDIVLDPFCGRARWVREVLANRRHVIVADVQGKWFCQIAGDLTTSQTPRVVTLNWQREGHKPLSRLQQKAMWRQA
jgi:DNA modification methylase